MNYDLIERYIYAVTKRLNKKQRDDVAQELRTLIDDMLTERCGERIPAEKDVRIVLTELGTPQELYSQYAEDADACLIGQPYYSAYQYILKIVLLSVVGGMTIAHGLLAVLEPKDILTMCLGWLNGIWNSLFGAFAFVTILFAWFQRKGVRIAEGSSLDDLPPVPKSMDLIPKWEPVTNTVWCILFATVFLTVPQVFCFIYEGKAVPLFDLAAIRDSRMLILGFSVCGIVREAVQLIEGRYNTRVMVTAWIMDAVSAALCIGWLKGFEVMNPAFVTSLEALFAGETDIVIRMFANFDTFFLGVMLFALALDAVDVTVRTLRK